MHGFQVADGKVTSQLSLNCLRYPLRAEKTLTLEGSKFTVSEDIVNTGEQEIELSWAQHIAYGEPFISSDLQIDIPAVRAVTHGYEMSHERIKRDVPFDWPMAPGLDGGMVDLTKIPDRNSANPRRLSHHRTPLTVIQVVQSLARPRCRTFVEQHIPVPLVLAELGNPGLPVLW